MISILIPYLVGREIDIITSIVHGLIQDTRFMNGKMIGE